MPKPRTKRQLNRQERKRKLQEHDQDPPEYVDNHKRQRVDDQPATTEPVDNDPASDFLSFEFDTEGAPPRNDREDGPGEQEFFGLLTDEEQEYFRGADEVLELNQFSSPEDKQSFIQNVYKEAEGKELKLASSQSCSRLMERLIMMSTKAQKKHLFAQFAGHFLTLVQHRFASHCCETLFLQSTSVVTQELGGFEPENAAADGKESNQEEEGDTEKTEDMSMEQLFLFTLDELEGHMGYLLTQNHASHTVRVLLVILSGRPLDTSATKSLLKSKKKERIVVPGLAATADEPVQQLRAVPQSFALAVQKIIADTVNTLDESSLRILAKHPTGNPTLQLLLELDLTLNHKRQKSKKEEEETEDGKSLLSLLLPGAPQSLAESDSAAADFVNTMMYDQIGSRLLETIIAHSPAKIFKSLYQNFFVERIQTYVRNDIASYPAIRVLNRISRADLIDCVEKILPTLPALVERKRLNVIKALFERCSARSANGEIIKLKTALVDAVGGDPKNLVTKLCELRENAAPENPDQTNGRPHKNSASATHGAYLITTLLATRGPSAKAAQTSLLSLTPDELVQLATSSRATVAMLVAALSHTSQNPVFHKSLVAPLVPHMATLATSQMGHNLVLEIISIPSKSKDRSIPFHMKESIMGQLANHEAELRDSWMGRSVWRTWKGDLWKRKRADWILWVKEVDGPSNSWASAPTKRAVTQDQRQGPGPERAKPGARGTNANDEKEEES